MHEALRRNAGRAGPARIVEVGIYTVAKRLVAPAETEGFDDRFEVHLADDQFIVVALG